MFAFLAKKAICRYRLWFLVENVLSFYPSFFLLQALLATIVGLFLSISHNILVLVQASDCKNCLKIACLKVTKQRDFFFFCFGVDLACWMYFTGLFPETFLLWYDQLEPFHCIYPPQLWITILPSCCMAAGTKQRS